MDRSIFFDLYRKNLDGNGVITKEEVQDIDVFLNFFERDIKRFTIRQWAYVFATVYHETGKTFKPLRESPDRDDAWRKRNFRYFPYYGRGYVQLTWERNYALYSKKVGTDLVKNPDKAMDPAIAWYVLVDGFTTGSFTGKRMLHYVNSSVVDYVNARRIINGVDKAQTIAGYANKFYDILQQSLT